MNSNWSHPPMANPFPYSVFPVGKVGFLPGGGGSEPQQGSRGLHGPLRAPQGLAKFPLCPLQPAQQLRATRALASTITAAAAPYVSTSGPQRRPDGDPHVDRCESRLGRARGHPAAPQP